MVRRMRRMDKLKEKENEMKMKKRRRKEREQRDRTYKKFLKRQIHFRVSIQS